MKKNKTKGEKSEYYAIPSRALTKSHIQAAEDLGFNISPPVPWMDLGISCY